MPLGRIFTRERVAPQEDRALTELWGIPVGDLPSLNLTGGAYRGALGIPGVWRAALLISDVIGALPWHAFRDNRRSQKVSRSPNRLLRRPLWSPTCIPPPTCCRRTN